MNSAFENEATTLWGTGQGAPEPGTPFVFIDGSGYGTTFKPRVEQRELEGYGQAFANIFRPAPVSPIEDHVAIAYGVVAPEFWRAPAPRPVEKLVALDEIAFISQTAFEKARERAWRPASRCGVGSHLMIARGGAITFGEVVDPIEDLGPARWAAMNTPEQEAFRSYYVEKHIFLATFFSVDQPDGETREFDDREPRASPITAAQFTAAKSRGWSSEISLSARILEAEVEFLDRLVALESRPQEWRSQATTFRRFLERTGLANADRVEAYVAACDAMQAAAVSPLLTRRIGVSAIIKLFGRRPASVKRAKSKRAA